MDIHVKNALAGAANEFAKHIAIDTPAFLAAVQTAFDAEAAFMEKVGLMDEAFDRYADAEPLREVFFDLLMVNFFAEDVNKLEEDYLDSKEWEDIEEETLDRGTELLNVLLYLRECRDEDIEPALDDFLKEFLLVDEDEFQDEHRIYEDVIANQTLMESDLNEIAKVSKKLPEDSEFKELFMPVMAFFYDEEPSEDILSEFAGLSEDPAFETAVYSLLANFNQ